MKLRVLDIGTCSHEKAHELQYKILADVQAGADDTLILVEHPKVITMGRNTKESNLLLSEDFIRAQGYDVRKIERGGDATYHGPGQIVGYTIFNLKKNHGGSIRTFVDELEDIFIKYLEKFHGIEATRDECNSGVFIGDSKITAVGLSVKRGVTMHGFAFNVNTNLEDYQVIVPCGLVDKGVTSVKNELGAEQDIELAKKNLVSVFMDVYGFDELEEISPTL